MKILSLDIGRARTGVAFYDDAHGILLPLQTIAGTDEVLIEEIRKIFTDRAIDRLVLGLPLLPNGAEGSQAKYVRSMVPLLQQLTANVILIDERYTTPKHGVNSDASAALAILQIDLDRRKKGGIRNEK